MASSQKVSNIVVVMLENRSYDNMLGWLYNHGNKSPYDQAPPGPGSSSGAAARRWPERTDRR